MKSFLRYGWGGLIGVIYRSFLFKRESRLIFRYREGSVRKDEFWVFRSFWGFSSFFC